MKSIAGYAYLTGAFTLAGTSVVAARFVCGSLGVFTIAAVSLLFALLGLYPFCRRFFKSIKMLGMKDWVIIAAQAFFGIFLFRMLLLLSLGNTTSAEAGLMTGATPAITALLAGIMLKEPFQKAGIAGILCTTAGVFLLEGIANMQGFAAAHFWGNLLALGAAACESVFNIISRYARLKMDAGRAAVIDPLAQTFLVSSCAFVLCLLPAMFEKPFQSLAGLDLTGWLALIWYGFFITALAFVCWYAGIKRCKAGTAAAFSGWMPFCAFVLSLVLLGEHASWAQGAGGVLVILGMVLIGKKNSERKMQLLLRADDDSRAQGAKIP